MQPGVMRAQKRVLIKNFIFSVKKYTFRSFYMELEVFCVIIQEIKSKTCYKFYE
jgi:hypothetical protein